MRSMSSCCAQPLHRAAHHTLRGGMAAARACFRQVAPATQPIDLAEDRPNIRNVAVYRSNNTPRPRRRTRTLEKAALILFIRLAFDQPT
jgi:hypothetical protein